MKEVKKATAKKPAAKAAPAAKPAAKPAVKASAVKQPVESKKAEVSPEQRYKMIEEAAYYIAERHGFCGDSAYFWSQAEAEINARFS